MNREGVKIAEIVAYLSQTEVTVIIIMDISKRNAYRVKTTSIAMVTISTSNSQKFFFAADVLRRCMAAILSPETFKMIIQLAIRFFTVATI